MLYSTWPGTVVSNKRVGACLVGIIGLIYVQQAFPCAEHSGMLEAGRDTRRVLDEPRLYAWLYGGLAAITGPAGLDVAQNAAMVTSAATLTV